MKFLVKDGRAQINAFVIMPNHIHLIWKINDKLSPSDVQRDFLKYTAQRIRIDMMKNKNGYLERFLVNAKDRKYQIWERNSLLVELYTKKVIVQKINYIHFNPLQEKWKLCKEVEDYKYSSAKFYNENIDNFGFLIHWNEIEWKQTATLA